MLLNMQSDLKYDVNVRMNAACILAQLLTLRDPAELADILDRALVFLSQ
jgi:hypothetical protein